MPKNFHEQIQEYFPNRKEKYLIIPVYSVNMRELVISAPFFDAPPFYETRQKCREFCKGLALGIMFLGKMQTSPCIFIISKRGEMTAFPFFPNPGFNDFTLLVYRSTLSSKWKQEVQDIFIQKEVTIDDGSWLCFSIYQYYAGCLCKAEDLGHSSVEASTILNFIDSLPTNMQDTGKWRQVWQPQITEKGCNEITRELKAARYAVIEEMPINLDSEKPFFAKHVVKVNGDKVIPCTEYVGKLSLAMQKELQEGKYTAIVYVPEEGKLPSDFNDFDSLRHYCQKNGLRLFYAQRNQQEEQTAHLPWIPEDALIHEIVLP